MAAFGALAVERCVLDGEVLVRDGEDWSFPALMARLHPAASRVARLAAETPATFVAFDVLAIGEEDLMQQPFADRRRRLEELLRAAPAALQLTPQLERTADCVVAGLRAVREPEPTVTSLLLGLYDGEGALRHVGVAASFGRARGRELFRRLRPLAILLEGGALGRLKGSAGRWAPGMTLDWLPLRPSTVCEVSYDRVDSGRLRHPARLRRFRDDRDPRSCDFDQLAEASGDGASIDG